jgi:lysophospholipase L1-like esterase
MRKKLEIFYLIFFTGFLNTPCFAQKTAIEYPDPNRFEEAILHFESLDSITFPPENAIVCVGSSSMRGWTGTITKDLAPLTVIPRGFGGSNMNDALYFSDRIILKYKPRAIVLYEGDNDIALGISPEIILEKFQEFAEKINHDLPECRFYFLSVKPSPSRWKLWPLMQKANRLIAEICEKDSRLTYVDVASGMLNQDEKPRKEIFKDDMLHMKREGYIIWRNALRPVLLENELSFEIKKSGK